MPATTVLTPYFCPKCGKGYSTLYTRCIGKDGKHTPTFPLPRKHPDEEWHKYLDASALNEY